MRIAASLSWGLIALLVCVSTPNGAIAQGPVKIGVLVPLSGDSASAWGEQVKQAVLLAKEKRPSPPVDLVFEDSQCHGSVAVSAARKLVEVDHVKVIIGDVCWTDLIAQVTEPAHVVVISTGSAQSTVRDAGDFIFRLKLDVSIDSRAIARTLIQKTSLRNVAVLYAQDQWGQGIADNFSDEFKKNSGNVVAREGFMQGSTDFRTVLLKIKTNSPDLLMIGAYPAQVGLIARQARQLGIMVQLAAYRGSLSDETLGLGGEALNGLLFLEEFDAESKTQPTNSFMREFKAKYSRSPSLFGAIGFDAYNLYADALTKCYLNTPCIRDFLYSTKNYPGVSGLITFDDHGDVVKELKLKQIQHGKFVDFAASERSAPPLSP